MKRRKWVISVSILPRKNELIRPAVANVDQALVVFAIKKPAPHFQSVGSFSGYDGKQGYTCWYCALINKMWPPLEETCRRSERFTGAMLDIRVVFISARIGREYLTRSEILLRRKDDERWRDHPVWVSLQSDQSALQQEIQMETGGNQPED